MKSNNLVQGQALVVAYWPPNFGANLRLMP